MPARPNCESNEFDLTIDRFDSLWHDGHVPDLKEFLSNDTSESLLSRKGDLLVELVMVDIEYRWRKKDAERGNSKFPARPAVEDYIAAFPELSSTNDLPKVIATEYRTRHRWGDQPAHDEYRTRFPKLAGALSEALSSVDQRLPRHPTTTTGLQIRCPHCHALAALDTPVLSGELECSSCQQSFRIVQADLEVEQIAPGRVLGNLRLREQLGSGSFGTVWKAHDEQLQREVAIKIPHRHQLQPVGIEQFLREARTAAQLNHPNIVRVHYVDRAAETVFIVSDLIEGEPLSDWLQGRSLSAREAASLCQSIAVALEHAHHVGVIHRDLKPSNILIDRGGLPHLTDFGLARREAGEVTITHEGQLLGTPAYMSPEQANGEAHIADRRSDIYSIGAILYELLTRERPFRGSVHSLLRQITEEDAPSPKKLNSSVPRNLETICLKCLEKSPAKRFSSANELVEELQRYLDGRPIHARPSSALTRGWRWCQRKPAAALAIGLLLLVAAVAPLVAVQQRRAAGRYRWKQYTSDMKVALAAWESGNVKRVLDLLRQHQTDYRGFEWYHLWRLCRPSETARAFPTVAPAWVAFSPDGRLLGSIDSSGVLHVWDLNTSRELQTRDAHSDLTPGLTFSPDGRTLASASWDGSLKLWPIGDTAGPTVLSPGPSGVPAEHRFFDVVFSPDGESLATNGPAGSVLIWNIQQRKVVRQFPGNGSTVWYLAFSSEGQLASGGRDGKVWLWNFATGEGRELSGHEPGVTCVSISPDGKTLISGGEDNLIKLWDVATGELKSTLRGHTHQVYTVVSSPSGAMLASASRDGTVRFWSTETRDEVAALRGFGGHVKDVAFSPDGHTLAAVGEDGVVKLWDVAAVTRNDTIEGTRVGYLTRDDEILVWNRGRLEIRNPTTLELTSDPSNSLANCVGRSPDGKYAALRHPEGTVDVLCVATGERRELPIWKEHRADSGEFSADNKYLVSTRRIGSSYRQRLKLWDWSNSVELLDCEFEWSKPAFSPGWELIAAYCTEGGDRVVKLWNRTGTEMARIPQPKPVFSLAFSADRSTLAVGTWRGTIEFWNVSSPERPFHLKSLAGHVGPVEAVDFGPHGRRLASGGRDRTVKLWDIATGDEMISLKGHRRRVTSVAFSPNGKTLVSCSEDERVVRFWRAASETEVMATAW